MHLAIYLRISDEKKTNGKRVSEEETLGNHKQRLVEYCDKNNHTYIIFQEIVSGGKDELYQRPKLEELINRFGEFGGVLVTELSRLSRDSYISALVKKHILRHRILILTPEMTYDLQKESDALMYDVGSAVSSHERAVIGKRIKNNKIELAKQGLNASGSAPLGYKRNPQTKRLEIDENEADTIRYIFNLCDKGLGAYRIQELLNNNGYRTKKGNAFTIRAVKDILKTQTYKGFVVYNNIENVMVDGKIVKRIKETFVTENAHPAIVAPELFDDVQKKREQRGERFSGIREKPSNEPSILKDLVYCAGCGRKVRIIFEGKHDQHLIRKCVDVLPDGSKCDNSGMIAESIENKVLEDVFSYQKELENEIELLNRNNVDKLRDDQLNLKRQYESQMERLKKEAAAYVNLEIQYAIDKMDGKNVELHEKILKEKVNKNNETLDKVVRQLKDLIVKMEQPTIQNEIDKRSQVKSMIDQIRNETSSEKINELLKQFIFKVHYKRVIPLEIQRLGVKNPTRKNFPAEIEIEYIK